MHIYDYGYNDLWQSHRMQDNMHCSKVQMWNTKLIQKSIKLYTLWYQKRCEILRAELSNEELENMTDEIYSALERVK